jgi:myosin heavy subunit
MAKDMPVEEKTIEDQLPPDPGELEGSKKDPKAAAEDMSPEHPRFREVYAKMKSYERELDTIRESWKNTDKLISGMRDHNQRLAEALEKAASKPAEREEPDPVAQIDVKIKELRSEKKKAMEDLKYGEAEDFQEQIEELKEQRLFAKAKAMQKTTQPQKPTENKPKLPEEDMRAFTKFVEDNSWYNEDPLMRAAALQLDAILVADPKWGNKPLNDRLDEVKRRIEKRFNYTDEENPTGRQSAAAVDSGRSGSPGSSGGRTNTLSPEEEAVARGLKLTNEQYIKQKRMGGA